MLSIFFSLSVARSRDVPAFGPPIPENGGFSKSPEFVDFLMAKGKPTYLFIISIFF